MKFVEVSLPQVSSLVGQFEVTVDRQLLYSILKTWSVHKIVWIISIAASVILERLRQSGQLYKPGPFLENPCNLTVPKSNI